ncbi:MAG: methyl-accepting chemotaxis protein [Acidobacteriia bacterium]|nr:methyl-accepting chemotaxis protein [Terriglobia bacterium]
MNRLGVRGKIWLSIAIFGLGYAALLILLQVTASQTHAHMQEASEDLFPAALSIQDAQAEFQKVIKSYGDAVVMQDKNSLAGAQGAAHNVIASLQSVKEKTGFDADLQKRVSETLDRFQDMTARAIPAYTTMIDAKDKVSNETMSEVGNLARQNKEMETSLAGVREDITKSFGAELASVTASSERQRTLGIVVFLLAVLCGSGMAAIVINRHILTPLRELTARLKDIAQGEGDLTKRLEVTSNDEIGEVAQWLNIFLEKLQKIIGQVAGSTQGVALSSEELTTVSRKISSNSDETSTQVSAVSAASDQVSRNLQTVATGAEEMSATIKDIAKNATEAARVASEAVKVAEDTNHTVSKLGVSSAEIGNVIKVINSIAQQTNLLALNATIEAARAGEAGKGFAVVANEVKELAKQTAKATEEISQKILAIQSDTKGAVDAIGTIGGVINQINDISNMIATAVEEQSATTNEMSRNASEAAKGSGDIARNIEGVAEAARSTSQGAANSEKAAQQLAVMSHELKELVEHFKV